MQLCKNGGIVKRSSLATIAAGLAAKMVLVLSVASCARSISSSSEIRAAMHPWVGQDIDDLIRKWGAPSSVFDLPTGSGKVYTWLYQGEILVTARDYPALHTSAATANVSYCRFDWNTDRTRRIESYRWEGRCKVKKIL